MGAWGYYDHPSEPLAGRYPDPYSEDRGWWDEMADYASMSEFIEREMSYEEAMAESVSLRMKGDGGSRAMAAIDRRSSAVWVVLPPYDWEVQGD